MRIDGLSIGFGSVSFGAFPEGEILLLGASIYYQIDGSREANLTATWEGDIAVGVSDTNNSSLELNERNIIDSSPIPAAVGKIASGDAHLPSSECGKIIDNTDDDVVLYINVLIDDTDISDDGVVQITGILTIAYIVMGDD